MNDNFVFGLTEIYLNDVTSENVILSGAVRKKSQVALLDQALIKNNKKRYCKSENNYNSEIKKS